MKKKERRNNLYRSFWYKQTAEYSETTIETRCKTQEQTKQKEITNNELNNRTKRLSKLKLDSLLVLSRNQFNLKPVSIQSNTLRFLVYKEGDTNANTTGGTRRVEYQLIAGEAGWILETKQK